MSQFTIWLLAALSLAKGAHGDDGMSTQTLVNIITVALVLGTWFFWYTSVTAERSYFLVLGSFCCALGNGIFAVMIAEEQGNPTWGAVYGCLMLAALHALYEQFVKYRRHGVFSDTESDDEVDNATPAPAAEATSGSRLLRPGQEVNLTATAEGADSASVARSKKKR
jgi:hypothetical protein